MNSKSRIIYYLLIGWLIWIEGLKAQDGDGGLEPSFSAGLGARALGMGSAAVAYPDDPSAFFWNPAGMVVCQQKAVNLSLTTLFEGTQYNFLGYVHPTMSVGTFGFGIARIGTGDITETYWERGIPVIGDDLDYWLGKVYLSYAMNFWKGLSAGINLNASRQVLGSYSTNGFGIDVGIHFNLPFKRGFLRDFYFGFNMSNILRPRMKLGTQTEVIPYTIRTGIAKLFFLRNNNDRCLLLADIEKGQYQSMRYHFGMEYGWNKTVFIRTGYDDGALTFGGGIKFRNFQLDYGSGRIADPEYFPRSHRFTLIFYFGKSIPEKKEMLEEQRRQEVQARINEQMEAARQKRISEGLKAGREYLEREDYFNARLAFTRVLEDDKNNIEAQNLLATTVEKEQDLQRRREQELLREDREKEKRLRDNAFVNERFSEGLDALAKGDFQKAIEKWQQALERDPENPQINTYIQQARTELSNEVNRMIARAKQLIRQENISEAYKVFGRAREQTEGNQELQNKVLREIETLDRIVDFITNYQEGVQRYGRGEYEAAAQFFKKALEFEPEHERAKELYRNSLARSKGKKTDMTQEVREKYSEGIRLYREGRYEEALKIWEEALALDPHNIRIVEAIDGAKRKIELYKKKE